MEPALEIDLPFDAESVIRVLEWGAHPETAPFSHRQIAGWCDRFWCQYMDPDAPREIERLLPILADVDKEWDMRAVHENAPQDQAAPLRREKQMPAEYFEEWLGGARADS